MVLGIALGGNVGDRLAMLVQGRDLILKELGGYLLSQASVWETEPVGCPPGSPKFLNSVIEIRVPDFKDWEQVLDVTQGIELALGRESEATRGTNAPRPLDIDLLYGGADGEVVVETPRLSLPHPRMRDRLFVLMPLSEVRPRLQVVATETSVEELIVGLATDEVAPKVFISDW